MVTIISNDSIEKHTVSKYNFKALSSDSDSSKDDEFKPNSSLVKQPKEVSASQTLNSQAPSSGVDSSAMSQSSKDALIESLMKKTDDMSSNFIKLQMKLEAKEEEYQEELKKVKQEAFDEGIQAGKAQASQESSNAYSNAVGQFAASVSTLENSARDYEIALGAVKGELITAALDIAKEVVSIELGESAVNIAKVLSGELIKELQSASKITLKVNPKDHGAISEHVGSLNHVEVISDSAVSEGGVIAISDAGNMDAQISKRFERVKRAALSE